MTLSATCLCLSAEEPGGPAPAVNARALSPAWRNQLTTAVLLPISLLSFIIRRSNFINRVYQPRRKRTREELRSHGKAETTAFGKITFDVGSEI